MNTKKIIREAAFELFKEQNFNSISVQMILERAEVSRRTFYKYYKDKYELMQLYYRSYMDDKLKNVYNGSNWPQILEELFQFVQEERDFFGNVKDSTGEDSFYRFLFKYAYEFYKANYLTNTGKDQIDYREHITMSAYIDGQITIFKEAIKKKAQLSPKEYAEICCELMKPEYYILEKEE